MQQLRKENSDFKEALNKQDVDNALAAGSQILGSVIELLGEGSTAAKIAAQGQNAIDTYRSATAAYASVVGIPVVGPVLAPIAAGVAIAAGLANAKKIASTKVPGGGNAPAPNISVPTGPSFNPAATVAAGDNVVTPDGQGTTTVNNQPVIKAYVISSDVTSQQEADAKINDLARL